MQCPFCQHPNNRVLESRSAESDRSIRRRRECLACERRFTTYERIEYVPITVSKQGGTSESFDRSKLLRGIVTACEKTGVSSHAMEMLVDEIEAELQQQAVREVSSEEIGERVLARLKQISEVAYVRFASVYRQFQGIRDFTETLSQLEAQDLATRSALDVSEVSAQVTVLESAQQPAQEGLPRSSLVPNSLSHPDSGKVRPAGLIK
ncbi:MAG: transcriptional regulator NrdR [Cyanobacteria bacterium P01_F01_bin.53]